MFRVYRALSFLLAPLLGRRLQRGEVDRARRQAGLRERRGRVESAGPRPIWIHAASVGEVNAITPLVQALLRRHPATPLLVSTFTLTGAEQVRRRFGDRVEHRLLPLDTAPACRRWLDTLQPAIALIAETEIWPELFHQIARRGIPLVLVNARLSDRGLRRSLRFRSLFARALQTVDCALCQSEEDARRLVRLGLESDRARVIGNLKFDASLPADLLATAQSFRSSWGDRKTWVAGSSRPGEEDILLEAHRILRLAHPDALLVLAPRHPERCDELIERLSTMKRCHQRLGEPVRAETEVVLVDRLGVLQACYAAGSIAFVGGSLVPVGGHNLLEPAALGKPVITGHHLANQQEMAEALDAVGALTRAEGPEDLATILDRFWARPELALERGRAALAVVEAGRGALATTIEAIQPLLVSPASPQRSS
jgi:3-deoxy-D-manno-octulosonic-acid transferase